MRPEARDPTFLWDMLETGRVVQMIATRTTYDGLLAERGVGRRQNLAWGHSPAVRTIEVAVEAYDFQVIQVRHRVGIVEVEAELLGRFGDQPKVLKRDSYRHDGSTNHVPNYTLEQCAPTPTKQEEPDRVDGVVRREEVVDTGRTEHGLGVICGLLAEDHFEEDIGVEQQPHSPPLRHRRISCCSSTDV